ncbi:hypothetical protein [Sulfurospirillum halorespirans]|uniref:Uncharacterized protein n=1 Tax=Sulfurospirillum halorespirans DSM 13726 TaxID=1193502 RepID=A0A1D7TFT7_9BACT|nr:hypothetical protein [Sulfurospirillum halorespirans]AOO63865.1 hypothetical protein SHALO_0063 [Sulfurospirillum halorespirans DSM 13726]
MDRALHPTLDKVISILEYKQFIVDNGHVTDRLASPARCPVCKHDMRLRGGQTQDNEHFYHVDHNSYCPTKAKNALPYLILFPTHPDPAIVRANKEFLKNHLEHIYTRILKIAPCLAFKEEFIEILKEASRLNIYAYANLKPEYLPYVLVTLINFLPSRSYQKKRIYKFIFMYDGGIENFDQLWIHDGFNANLYRYSYNNTTPITASPIETNIDYLSAPYIKLSPKQIDWCNKII